MKRLIITEPVSIQGPNYWGRNSLIRFSPSKQNGWYWDTGNGIVPISHKIVSIKNRRMALCANNKELNVYEHIGALRFLGIDNIIIKSSKWPPYDGSAWIYYDALKSKLEEDGNITWVKIIGGTSFLKEKGLLKTYGEIRENKNIREEGLLVSVKAGWKPLETLTRNLFIHNEEDLSLLEILKTKAQGYPFFLYHFAKVASFFGWPHKKNLTWLKNNGPEKTAELFLRHRILDLLGAISLYDHKSLPSGKIISSFGGHKNDILLLEKYFCT